DDPSSLAITDSSSPAAKPDTRFSDTDGTDLVSQSGSTFVFEWGLDQNETQSTISTLPPAPYPSHDEIPANSSAAIDLSDSGLDRSPFASQQQPKHVSAVSDNAPASPSPEAGASVPLLGSAGVTAISDLASPAAGPVSSDGGPGAGAAVAGGTAEAML